jgi:hypothetical protein
MVATTLLPVAVLAHELGHFLSDLAFGFEGASLHYAYSGFAGEQEFWRLVRAGNLAAAADIASIRHVGISALNGLLVTYALIALGLRMAARRSFLVPLAIALGSAARLPLVLLLSALGRAEHTDEAHVAQALGVPEALAFAASGLALLAAVIGGWHILSRHGHKRLIAPMFAGVVAGTVLWTGVIGPLVLP